MKTQLVYLMKEGFQRCGIIILVLAASAVYAQDVNRTFSGIKKINLSTASGDIILAKGSNKEVSVKVKFTYSTKDYEPIFDQDGSTLILKETFAKRNSANGSSNWTLTIPDGLDVKINSGSGNIEATGLEVSVNSNTGSGDYNWTNVSGDSKINTGSGDIKIDQHTGDIDVNAGSGNIAVTQATGSVRANAGSGDLSFSMIKGGVSANSGSGNIKARDLTLTAKGAFNTGSGDVLVVLSAPLAYNLSVNSGSGDAIVDLKGSKLEGKLVMTANKKNGEIKAPFTFDKTETIDDEGSNERIRKTVQLGSSTVEVKIGTGSGTAEVRK